MELKFTIEGIEKLDELSKKLAELAQNLQKTIDEINDVELKAVVSE